MIHDRVASAVQLAKGRLFDLDPKAEFVTIEAKTFRLLLETLIEVGTPARTHKIDDATVKNVMQKMAGFNARQS